MYNLKMEFTKSLIKGKLIKRYKRFFVDVKLDKAKVTAHCPNTGSMKGLLDEGNEVYLLKNDDPKRKLKYTLEIIKAKGNLVGVNTHMLTKLYIMLFLIILSMRLKTVKKLNQKFFLIKKQDLIF